MGSVSFFFLEKWWDRFERKRKRVKEEETR